MDKIVNCILTCLNVCLKLIGHKYFGCTLFIVTCDFFFNIKCGENAFKIKYMYCIYSLNKVYASQKVMLFILIFT